MEHEKIERINELARKMREVGLTEEEQAERKALHREYIDGFKENLKAVLEGVVIQNPDGSREPLKKKKLN